MLIMLVFVMLGRINLSYLPSLIFALILLVSLDITRIRSNIKFCCKCFSCLLGRVYSGIRIKYSAMIDGIKLSTAKSTAGTSYSLLHARHIFSKSIAANLLVSELSIAGPPSYLRNPLKLDCCSKALVTEPSLKT